MADVAHDFNFDNLMSDLDAVVFARAGKPVDKTERDPKNTLPVTCEKTGPMHWIIHIPGRESFLWCVYAITHDGVEHKQTFTSYYAPDQRPDSRPQTTEVNRADPDCRCRIAIGRD